jgi:hypothetical protein
MAYMVMQRIISAVRRGYRGSPEVAAELERARGYRLWLEGLSIEDPIRNELVEMAGAIEVAFADLEREAP